MIRFCFPLYLVIFHLFTFVIRAEGVKSAENTGDDILKMISFLEYVVNLVEDANDTKLNFHLQGRSEVSSCEPHPIDCTEVLQCGHNEDGVYKIWPRSRILTGSMDVYCDMTTDGGGWTVFQRRGFYGEDHLSFYRDWQTYKEGFGDIREDFWLGNELLHILTNQKPYSLRVDMKDWKGEGAYALYQQFWIEGEENQYALYANGYRGNAGNSLFTHSRKQFTTIDRDNDMRQFENCAQTKKGGWWYHRCFHSNLNGPYFDANHSTLPDGIVWKSWKGYYYSLPFVEMKIRPLSSE